MLNKIYIHIHIHILYLTIFLLLFASPHNYVVAQSADQFQPNTGYFTPSTVIIIIIGIIFILTAFLAVFLRQFSGGCFGLSVVSGIPGVTADGRALVSGLDAEAIKSIPTYFYSDVKQHRLGKAGLECAVCLCEFQDPEALRLLPGCSHVFHPRCIDPWLVSHVTCPICRRSLEPGSGDEKPCSIINIPSTLNESNGSDDATQRDHHERRDNQSPDHESGTHLEYACDDDVGKRIVTLPRSHSTGHSLADSERFTLRLPDDVQNRMVNRSGYGGTTLTRMASPRCGWFSMTPPLVNPRSSLVRSPTCGSKKLPLPPVKTSERLWPI